MKITAESSFPALASFLNLIGLIISMEPPETTLAQLFPGYDENGALPEIRVFSHGESMKYRNFLQVENNILIRPEGPIFLRGHVVFAWKRRDPFQEEPKKAYLEPLCKLFEGVGDDKCWVFNTETNRWASLHPNELKRMGIGYRSDLVDLQRRCSFMIEKSTNTPTVDGKAHKHASNVANHKVDMMQAGLARAVRDGHMTDQQGRTQIKDMYEQEYIKAFNSYIDEHVKHHGHNQASSSLSQMRI